MSGLRAARHSPSRHAVKGPGRQIRPQLVRAAVLPTLAAGLSGAAAVMFTLHLGGGSGARDDRLWPVLAGCALLAVGALAAALLGAQRAAKAVRDRCEALRRSSVRGREELRTAAERLERGEGAARPVRGDRAAAPPEGDQSGVDEFWLLAQELRGAREQAQTTLVRLALPPAPSDSDRKVEVFVNLARRLQSLVHREISLLDGLEDTVEDPDLLKELFHVDHLATRIRRHAENLAVLGGAASRRQWTRPIDLSEVLRSSVAEVEQYTRVKVVPPAGGTVRGHAVADVVHLLAELVENATVFSAPDTDVVVRAERVTAGIAVEVEDRGLGMPAEEQHRMNTLLGDPDQVSVRHLLADGRIGLFVVSALARRHGIAVELKSNIYGGVLAVLVLPQGLLGAEAPGAADAAGGSRATSWGTVSWPDPPRPTPPTPTAPREPLPPPPRPSLPEPPPRPTPARYAAADGPGLPTPGHAAAPVPAPYAASDAGGFAAPVPGQAADPAPAPYPAPGAEGSGLPAPGQAANPLTAPVPYEDPGADGLAIPAPGRAGVTVPLPYAAQGPAGSGLSGRGRAADPDSGGVVGFRVPDPGRTAEPAQGPGRLAGGAGFPDPGRAAGQVRGPAPLTGPAPGQAPYAVPVRASGPGEGPVSGPVPGEVGPGAAPGAGDPAGGAAWGFWRAPDQAPDGVPAAYTVPDSTPAPAAYTVPDSTPAPAAYPAPGGGPDGVLTPALPVPPAPSPGSEPAGPAALPGAGGSVQVWDPAPAPGLEPAWPRGPVSAQPAPAEPWAAEPRRVPQQSPAPEGTRPPLPRRRAQTHLAPQLREAPAPRRAEATEQPVHDPGLMAAFQRGFGLAQADEQA